MIHQWFVGKNFNYFCLCLDLVMHVELFEVQDQQLVYFFLTIYDFYLEK